MDGSSRRALLAALAGGVAAIAGCTALDNSRGDGQRDTTATQTPASADDEATGTGASPSPTPEPAEAFDVAQATAWPSRRGPSTNTGASTTAGVSPDAEPAATAALRDGHGVSNRAPVVGEDAVYAIAGPRSPYDQSPPRFACYAYALSRADGSEVWRQTLEAGEGTDSRRIGDDHSLCLGPDGLYVTWLGPDQARPVRVARLSPSDGSKQWRQTVSPTSGTVSQPVVRDGRVYQRVDDRIVAFDAGDGSRVWETPERLVDQPVPTVGEDVVVVYHRTPGEEFRYALTAFEGTDGSVRWQKPGLNARRPIAVIAGDTVYVADGDSFGRTGLDAVFGDGSRDRPRRFVYALSLADGSERWVHTYDTDEIYDAATPGGTSYLTVTERHVYYALGFPSAVEVLGTDAEQEALDALREQLYRGPNIVALDRADGSVDWRTTVGTQARVFQPTVAGPDALYALYRGIPGTNEESRVYVVDRESGDIMGSIGPVETQQPFAVADDTLYTHRRAAVQAWA